MLKIYGLWMEKVNDYFAENKLNHLLYNLSKPVNNLIKDSNKSFQLKRNSITMRLKKDDKYISYCVFNSPYRDNSLDTNIGTISDYEELNDLMREIATDIHIFRIKKHLELGDKYEGHILSFLEYFNKSIRDISISLTNENLLLIKCPSEEEYFVVSTNELSSNNLLKANEHNLDLEKTAVTYNGYKFYQLKIKEDNNN